MTFRRHRAIKTAIVLVAATWSAMALVPLAQAQYGINLFAGGGPNNLAATASSIGFPGAVVQDAAGNTYFSDPYTSRVFKVDTTGNLTVFAGTGAVVGVGGYAGDGGPATAALLSAPDGLAVDAAGDVFIADSGNSVIRCVVESEGGCLGSSLAVGSITTVAGIFYPSNDTCNYGGDLGPATSAYLCQPAAIALDSAGDLFIADTLNSVIREVSASNQNIQTVAGNANLGPGFSGDGAAATGAQLDLPAGVAVDGAGNLYIADTFNSVIRCVVASEGGCLGSEVATGDITTVVGTQYAFDFTCGAPLGDGGAALSAFLCAPAGVAIDSAGDIFIADTLNSEVREVVAETGDIQAFAGTGGTPGYSGDGAAATGAEIDDPNGLFLDAAGDVFIADTENFVIREVTDGTINTVAGNHTVAYSGDGSAPTNASLNAPGATFVDAAGDLFIADTDNCVIREVPAGGNITTVAGSGNCGYAGDGGLATAVGAELDSPGGVFVDGGGNIYIADTGNSVIRCVVESEGGCLGSAQAAGNIVTIAGTGIGGYSGDGAAASAAQLYNPNAVFVDAAGDVFIADTANSIIRCIVGAANGCLGSALAVRNITSIAGTPDTPCSEPSSACGDGAAATSAQLNFPAGVYGDAGGDILIADTFDSKIRCVVGGESGCYGSALAVGSIVTVAGTGVSGYSGDGAAATAGMLNDPYGLFVDSFDNIFVADTFNSVVREVVAVTGDLQTAAGNGTEGYLGDGGAGSAAELANPLGLAGDSSGDIYVADTENARVREMISTVDVDTIPTSATLPSGASQQFAANVTGAADRSVTWQVNGITGGNAAVGTISTLGSYEAPAAIPSNPTVSVTAINNANGVNRVTAPVTIVSGTTLTVTLSTSPTVTEVYTGTNQSFVANVTGNSNTAVNWMVNGIAGGNATVGTISGGAYTAPSGVPSPSLVVIGAASQVNTSVVGQYPVTVVIVPTATEPAPQTISPGGTANYSISLNANTGDPRQPITLACLLSTLPGGSSCVFSPSVITPSASAVPFTLAISVPSTAAKMQTRNPAPWLATMLPMAAIALLGGSRRRRAASLLVLALMCIGLVFVPGCSSGNATSTGGQQPQTYSVQVQGTTAAQPNPVTLTTASLTVN